jgi:hypothetical protein
MPIANTRLTQDLLGPLADKLAPECVTPLVTYLVSEQCELTHELFSVGGGRYARVFVGLATGWNAGPAASVSAEDIAANLDAIREQSGYTVPTSIGDEMKVIAEGLKD